MYEETSQVTCSGKRGRQCSRHTYCEYCQSLSSRYHGWEGLPSDPSYLYLMVDCWEMIPQAGPLPIERHDLDGWGGCCARARGWRIFPYGQRPHHRARCDESWWGLPSWNPGSDKWKTWHFSCRSEMEGLEALWPILETGALRHSWDPIYVTFTVDDNTDIQAPVLVPCLRQWESNVGASDIASSRAVCASCTWQRRISPRPSCRSI